MDTFFGRISSLSLVGAFLLASFAAHPTAGAAISLSSKMAAGSTSNASAEPLTVRTYLTYGRDGGKRNPVLISGDVICVQFCVDGLQIGKDDLMECLVEMTMNDREKNTVATSSSARVQQLSFCGGSSVCTRGQIEGAGSPEGSWLAGEYEIRTQVTDLINNRKAQCSLPIRLLPRDSFGAIDLQLSQDRDGRVPASECQTLGSKCYLTCSFAGFTITEARFRVAATHSIERKEGKEWKRTFVQEWLVEQAAEHSLSTPMGFAMHMHRPGKYVVQLKLKDLLAKEPREALYRVPLVIVDPSAAAEDEQER